MPVPQVSFRLAVASRGWQFSLRRVEVSGFNPMKQAIAGVSPPNAEEVTVMQVFPSIARYFAGQMLGKLYSMDVGVSVLTLGNFIALASIPLALLLYFYRVLPSVLGISLHGSSYKLTNRRVIEQCNEVIIGVEPRPKRITIAVVLLVIGVLTFTLLPLFLVVLHHSLVEWAWATSKIQSTLKMISGLMAAGGGLSIVGGIALLMVEVFDVDFDAVVKSIELDRFDTIEIDCKPGQAWFAAGDLVFKRGDVEAFRLEGVSRPESFRHTCLKSHMSYVGVKQALDRTAVPA